MIRIGDRLRSLRKSRGITLRELRDRTGISISFLADLEHGRTNPSLKTLQSLASFYLLKIEDLVSEEREPATIDDVPAEIREAAMVHLRSITFCDADSNMDRYCRGFNDGYEFAIQQMQGDA